MIALALEGEWTFAATIATGSLIVGLVVLPVMLGANPLTAILVTMLKPLAWIVAIVFGAIAVWRANQAEVGQPGGFRAEPAIGASDPALESTRERGDSTDDESPFRRRFEAERPTEWRADVLERVEWKRFEDLCCAFYREKGIGAETSALGADGGVDIRLFQDDANPARATAIVQCKAHNKPIGVKPIRELRGVMAHEKAEKAFFMAPSGFTEEARAFAAANRITLLDGKLFLAMLKRLPETSSRKLLEFATDGDWTTPTCPSCGEPMAARESKRGGFWGCTTFPRCRGTLPMRAAVGPAG